MKAQQASCSILSWLIALSLVPLMSQAQIGAEAQGGKFTTWCALGIDYELSARWTSVTDLGYGRHSDPDNALLLKRQGLNVITQDFIRRVNSHWRFALSAGYWRRNAYSEDTPYNARPFPYEFRNELRPYQRLYYDHQVRNLKITHTLRADERFYYDQDFHGPWTTPFEFRARYMVNVKIPLGQNGRHWIIPNDEVLSAIDQYATVIAQQKGGKWSPYQLTENRLSLYYRHSFREQRIDIDIGLMHQYWRERPGLSHFNTSYNIMLDVIIRDPFRKKKD